jgi:hypothetical protein
MEIKIYIFTGKLVEAQTFNLDDFECLSIRCIATYNKRGEFKSFYKQYRIHTTDGYFRTNREGFKEVKKALKGRLIVVEKDTFSIPKFNSKFQFMGDRKGTHWEWAVKGK